MALYGDLEHVKKMIRAETTWTVSDDADDRLDLIQSAVSLAIEEQCGCTFGASTADTSELHWVGSDGVVLLNKPARSITSLRYGGTMSGSTMTGGTTITSDDLVNVIASDNDGLIYAIAHNTIFGFGGFTNRYSSRYTAKVPVIITGDFATTDSDNTVPDDITYAATRLIAEVWKEEQQSTSGLIDQDGNIVSTRNPFNLPMVKKALDKYSVKRRVPAV